MEPGLLDVPLSQNYPTLGYIISPLCPPSKQVSKLLLSNAVGMTARISVVKCLNERKLSVISIALMQTTKNMRNSSVLGSNDLFECSFMNYWALMLK